MSTVTPQPVPTPPRPDAGADAAVRAALAALTRLLAETPGQPVPAVIGSTLPNGLTQVLAASRQFTLQLPATLPAGLAVTLATSTGPQGPQLQIRPQIAPAATPSPSPAPTPAASPQPLLAAAPSLPSAPTAALPPSRPLATVPHQAPTAATATLAGAPAIPDAPTPPPAVALQNSNAPTPQPAVSSTTAAQPVPQWADPARAVAAQASAPTAVPSATSEPDAPPLPANPAAPVRPAVTTPPASSVTASASGVQAYRALQPAPPPMQAPSTAAAPAIAEASITETNDPVSLVLRQQNATPLLARLVAVVARPDLPADVRQAALKILAGRVSLDGRPPDGATLRNALAAALPQSGEGGTTAALLDLRQALGRLIARGVEMRHTHSDPTPPPLRGEAPRAAPALPPLAADGDRQDLVHHLATQADGAAARHKLLQLGSSQPADPRAPSGPELRVEVPMMLAGETGMVQFVIEREARRSASKRERGWRLRFALNFSALGEVGADVALLGRRASVAIWADAPETAASLAALADDLAPALARHGLDLGSFELRRAPRPAAPPAPGQVLDSPR